MTAITITDAAHDYLADLLSKQNTPGSASASLSPSPAPNTLKRALPTASQGKRNLKTPPWGSKASPRTSTPSAKPSSTTPWSTTPPTVWVAN